MYSYKKKKKNIVNSSIRGTLDGFKGTVSLFLFIFLLNK